MKITSDYGPIIFCSNLEVQSQLAELVPESIFVMSQVGMRVEAYTGLLSLANYDHSVAGYGFGLSYVKDFIIQCSRD